MKCFSGLVANCQNLVFSPSHLASWINKVREWSEVFWDAEEGVSIFSSEDVLYIVSSYSYLCFYTLAIHV